MKKTSIFLLFILTFSVFSGVLPIQTNDNMSFEHPLEDGTLASTLGSDVNVIRVSDDTFTVDDSPDANFDDFGSYGGLVCGLDSIDATARIWMKFNLSLIPHDIHFTRATVNLFLELDSSTDEPLGVYYSDNDTWTESTITWNNEPETSPVPLAVIDSPSNPNMFLVNHWYEWEITDAVRQTLADDGILTILLRLVDESSTEVSLKGFMSRENSILQSTNTIPNIALEYEIPATNDLQVDGFSESPQIDYINNPNPDFSWTFNDDDVDDFQKNYELEVWNSSSYDETQLTDMNNTHIAVVHDTEGAGIAVDATFNIPYDVRVQYKWPASMIPQSGVVDKLYFEVDKESGTTTFSDLAIYMISVEVENLTTIFESNYDYRTPIQVLNRSSYTAKIENGYVVFDIENLFVVQSNLNLIIELRHTGATGTNIKSVYTDDLGSLNYVEGPGYYASYVGGALDGFTQGLKLEIMSDTILSDGASSNGIPFNMMPGFSLRVQYKYNQSLIQSTGFIDRLLFPATGFGDVKYLGFSVYLVETPLKGPLNETDMNGNYGGQIPSLVLSQNEYVVRNLGQMLVIDVNDTFYYTGTNDLLVELRFTRQTSGGQLIITENDRGVYRAYNTYVLGSDTIGPDLYIDFIRDLTAATYSGTPFTNATTYYWRVRTCDSLGVWSPWATSSFKFEIVTSVPTWSNLMGTPDLIELGDSLTVSIDVTHITGISQVLIEYTNANHSMSNFGDTYSYTWTPDSVGYLEYTIYMESTAGTWNSVSDNREVVDTTPPTWVTYPSDKVLEYGEPLSYQLTATDLSEIPPDGWMISDAVNFQIIDGLLTNRTILSPGGYRLNVTVFDIEGNSLSASFKIAVLGPNITTTTTTTSLTLTTTTTTTSSTSTTTSTPIVSTDSSTLMLIIYGLLGVILVLVILLILQFRRE